MALARCDDDKREDSWMNSRNRSSQIPQSPASIAESQRGFGSIVSEQELYAKGWAV
jgi:hypothetical protein